MSLFSAPTIFTLFGHRLPDVLAAAEQSGLFAGERREHDRRGHAGAPPAARAASSSAAVPDVSSSAPGPTATES